MSTALKKILVTLFTCLGLLFLLSCKENVSPDRLAPNAIGKEVEIKYAQGFGITDFGDHQVLTIKNPWPGSDQVFKYALIKNGAKIDKPNSFDAVIAIPVNRIVVTSTTHIPSLESLNVLEALVGFPGLDYISSEPARERINAGKIQEVGRNEDINTELMLSVSPDVVVGFAVDGQNSTFNALERAGIPVIYNSDWTESSPLGKAEWVKFFGALFDKREEAANKFATIERDYLAAKTLASKAATRPTVISGALYKDVWYMPQGNSWGATFIADANGDYLWSDTEGTGSLFLNIESVLEKGSTAAIWIGPGQFTSLSQMKDASKAYTQIKAFKEGMVYSYNSRKGEKGGSVYFELAPNRPDIVLRDMIKILHPELLPGHQLFFFTQLH